MLSDEQRGLQDAVRGLLAKHSDSAAVRRAITEPNGYDEKLWRLLCDQIGVAALAIDEAHGGAGASLRETHVVLEELGRTVTPAPLLGSVLAARLLIELGDEPTCARLLPAIAAGQVVGVCWADERGWDALPLTSRAGVVDGTAHYVLDGDTAELLLAITPDGVVEIDPATPVVRRVHTPTMDLTRRLATISFDGAPGRVLPGDVGAALPRVRDALAIAQTAEQVGAMTRLLDITVDYTKTRVQFGRPIGSFQALKHRMADLHVLVEAARSASYAAVEGTVTASVAATYCAEALFTVAAEAIQLHGGIAITWEHDAHLYFKRAQAGTQLFGSPARHLDLLTEVAGL